MIGSSSRSLMPREHGAYGQLGLPVAVGLASGRPSVASILLAIAATCAFLAREPLRVALGHRGTKARRVDGVKAMRRALLLGALAAILGVLALVLAPAARYGVLAIGPVIAIAMALA